MEENELFGEAHEQEENGLFGRRHQSEQLNLCGVVKPFYCDNKHNNIPNMNCEKQCWFCRYQKLDK
jgi:hypothetical protein